MTLEPHRNAAHPPRHGAEQIILVKDGQLEATIGGVARTAGTGSIVFLASNDAYTLSNRSDAPVTYYVLRLVTEATPAPAP